MTTTKKSSASSPQEALPSQSDANISRPFIRGRPLSLEQEERLEALADIRDEDIDLSDIPETTEEDWKDAVRGWLPLERRSLSLALDAEVYRWIEEEGTKNARLINHVIRRELQRQVRMRAENEASSPAMSKAS